MKLRETSKELRLQRVDLVPINPKKYLENASMENISKEFSKCTDKGWPPFVIVSDIDRVHCYLCSQTLPLNIGNNRNDEEYHDLY